MQDEGSILFQDEYGVIHESIWTTKTQNGIRLLDITTTTRQPNRYLQPSTGRIINKQVFRDGICTVYRQIIKHTDDGYEIVSEGGSQTECTYQSTFNCMEGPKDLFKYHLDNLITEEVSLVTTSGYAFGDPDATDCPVFCDLDVNGVPLGDGFGFDDVWA